VPDTNGLTIWGRANSVNVQKVLWCLTELDLAYQRIDAGMQFRRNDEPDYLVMNPNGRVPTLVDGDFVLWESNSIMRYLCLAYRKETPIYPEAPKRQPRSTAGWTGRSRPCSRSIVRCSGPWCERHRSSAT
jgi:glutathione S-transferase